MSRDDVTIFHPTLGISSTVTKEAAEVWLGHGWTVMEDGNDAAVSRVETEKSADEPSYEEN